MHLTMGSNRDFALRREWINYLAEMADEAEEAVFLNIDSEEDWFLLKTKRPVTAHLLEELFGYDEARHFVNHLDEGFTETKAVKIVSYVYNSPKKYKRYRKVSRADQFNSVRRKE